MGNDLEEESEKQPLQNTILNDMWEDSYSIDLAVLQTFLMHDLADPNNQEKSEILTTL